MRHRALPRADPESAPLGCCLVTVKPEIEFPYGDPPSELDIVDITEGTGAEAESLEIGLPEHAQRLREE